MNGDDIYYAYILYYDGEWYYYDAEYIEEGFCGPFINSMECILHASWGDYIVSGIDMSLSSMENE